MLAAVTEWQKDGTTEGLDLSRQSHRASERRSYHHLWGWPGCQLCNWVV